MIERKPEFLTSSDLIETRGWTRRLIEKFLGVPDDFVSVNHWLNWSGKRAWLIQTVELAEMTREFELSFLRSAKIRKISREQADAVIERIYALREVSALTPEEIESDFEQRLRVTAKSASSLISLAREKGYRTPHKC